MYNDSAKRQLATGGVAGPTVTGLSPAAAASSSNPLAGLPTDPNQAPNVLASDLATGNKYATDNGIGAAGSMGRISDPRAQDEQSMLSQLQERTKGMSSAEMQAAREQAQTGINRQFAQNQEQLASTAGAQGISGPAAAALQARAGGLASEQNSQFQRQLVLDNIAQQNQALGMYGSALGQQQGTELGIAARNQDTANAETLARQSTPFSYASLLEGVKGGITSNALNSAGIGAASDAVSQAAKALAGNAAPTAPTGYTTNPETGGAIGPATTNNPSSAAAITFARLTPDVQANPQVQDAWKTIQAQSQSQQYLQSLGNTTGQPVGLTPEQMTTYQAKLQQDQSNPAVADALQTYTNAQQGQPIGADKGAAQRTIICTEAYRQGLISSVQYQALQQFGTRQFTSFGDRRAYLRWAAPVVRLMRRNPAVAAIIAKVLPGLSFAEGYDKGRVSIAAHIAFYAFRFLNKAFKTGNSRATSFANAK